MTLKNKYLILISVLLLNIEICFSQVPNWHWAFNSSASGTISHDEGTDLALDQNGNIYTVGFVQSSFVSFGTYNYSTLSGGADFFVNKFDSNGNILWQKFFGGNSVEISYSLDIDIFGNILLAGSYGSNPLIIGMDTLTNFGGNDVFIMKLNSNGNVIWTKKAGEYIGSAHAGKVTTDQNGNIYTSGYFYSSIFKAETDSIINKGGQDIYFIKYDINGNLKWLKQIAGPSSESSNTIVADKKGNIYLTGYSNSDSLVIDSSVIYNPFRNPFSFILKYDTSGTLVWRKIFVGGIFIFDSEITQNNNLIITGSYYSDSIIIGQDTLVKSPGFSQNMFIAKFSSNGNDLWALSSQGRQGSGFGSIFNKGYSVTSFGNYHYAMGSFSFNRNDTISFGSIVLTKPNGGLDPSFIVKFNLNGSPICAFALPTGGDDNQSIKNDNSGNLFICGDYGVNPFVLDTISLIKTASENYFLAKFDFPCDEPIGIEEFDKTKVQIYPNPFTTQTTFIISKKMENASLLIFNNQGKIISNKTNITGNSIELNRNNIPEGLYIFQLIENGKILKSGKLIVVN